MAVETKFYSYKALDRMPGVAWTRSTSDPRWVLNLYNRVGVLVGRWRIVGEDQDGVVCRREEAGE